MGRYSELFTPMRIGKCDVKNRYVMEPMGPAGLADASGAFNDKAAEFYVERARGGVGLIITGMCYVENTVEWHANGTMPCPTVSPALFKRTGIQLTERVHAYGTKIFLQLSPGFGRVSNRIKPGEKPIAPSEIPYRWDSTITCRAISTQEVESLVRAMGQAASIAKESGFDGVEIHAMHEGYLIDQFAMAYCNHRTDKYGGSLENRIRFAVEILQEIKNACGENFPVVMRYGTKSFMKDFGQGALPGEVFQEKGRDTEEGLVIAGLLERAGYDALDADVGCYDAWYWNHPPMYFGKGMYLPFNEELKRHVSIPVLTAGRLDDPEQALEAVRKGQTDFIGLARPLLADAWLVEKVRKNTLEDIRPCLSCQEGCMGRLKKYLSMSCAVNPAACREKELALHKTEQPKAVAVIGGGIAGCEAARVLKLRGHEPVLFEVADQLGGKLLVAGTPDFKEDDRALIRWYQGQLKKLGIQIHLGKKISEAAELKEFDCVIDATGSDPVTIDLGDAVPVINVGEVMKDPDAYAEPFAIVGGGLVGCEAALMLVQRGKRVSIVEAMPEIMALNGPLCFANRQMLTDLISYHEIPVYANSMAEKTDQTGLKVKTGAGETNHVEAATVVLSIGYRSDKRLYKALLQEGKDVYIVGDAKGGAGNILHSIWEAYEVAANL